MHLIFITNKPDEARVAAMAGVDRILVDLELAGKPERQKRRDTRISHHNLDDVGKVRQAAPDSELVVRTDPFNRESALEINRCIDAGADRIMLPMFRHAQEVSSFAAMIAGRARFTGLLETASALARVDAILDVPEIDDIHIGLNDLHLELRLDFMFEVLSGGIVEYLARRMAVAGVPFGFGGVAPIECNSPLPATLVLSEHVRLGSSAVILSRDFNRILQSENRPHGGETEFVRSVSQLRQCLAQHSREPEDTLETNRRLLLKAVSSIVGRIANSNVNSDKSGVWPYCTPISKTLSKRG